MTVLHHPVDETLLGYANGSLPFALALVVAAHLDGCQPCRQTVVLAEALAGAFLDRTPPNEIAPDALSRALERLDAMVEAAPVPASGNYGLELPPALARQRIGKRRRIAPGFWVRSIVKDIDSGTRAYLLGAAAGKSIPQHGHQGVEMTLVVKGDFFDGDVCYGPGDFLQTDDSGSHRPIAGPEEECICAIASRGVPTGWLGLLIRIFT